MLNTVAFKVDIIHFMNIFPFNTYNTFAGSLKYKLGTHHEECHAYLLILICVCHLICF